MLSIVSMATLIRSMHECSQQLTYLYMLLYVYGEMAAVWVLVQVCSLVRLPDAKRPSSVEAVGRG